MGVLGTEGVEASWILKDFESFNINTEHCVIKDVHCPVGTIILNMTNGTRTILFFPRDRPEMLYEDFQLKFKKDFSAYSWIHFEVSRSHFARSIMKSSLNHLIQLINTRLYQSIGILVMLDSLPICCSYVRILLLQSKCVQKFTINS
uniref:Uncharacterized protein n=1 Tax=Biomphalaria glabrata TaxID=6526 RepID=A0A2C9M3T9_BIOGL